MRSASIPPRRLIDAGLDARRDAWARPAVLVAMAGIVLALGLLPYLTDRVAGHASLIPVVPVLAGRHFFGVLGQWLPSFAHPFAFALLTAAALPLRLSPAYGACVAWGVVDVAFEIGQHPALSGGLAMALRSALGDSSPARALTNYFLRGTFDVGDLVAAVLGALAAAAALRCIHPRLEAGDA